jgi:hypothetical protein
MRAAIAGALPHTVSRTSGSPPQLHAGDYQAYEGLGSSKSDQFLALYAATCRRPKRDGAPC